MYYLLFVSILHSYAAIRNDYGLSTENGGAHQDPEHHPEFIRGATGASGGIPILPPAGAPLPLEGELHGDLIYGASGGVAAEGSVGGLPTSAHTFPTYRSHKGLSDGPKTRGQRKQHLAHELISNPLANSGFQGGNGISPHEAYADRIHQPFWRSSIVAGAVGDPIIPLRNEKIKPRRDPWIWEAHFGTTSHSSSKSLKDSNAPNIRDPSTFPGIFPRGVVALHPSLLRDPQHQEVLPRADLDNRRLIEPDPLGGARNYGHYIEPRSAKALDWFSVRDDLDDDGVEKESADVNSTTTTGNQLSEMSSTTATTLIDDTTTATADGVQQEENTTSQLLDTSTSFTTNTEQTDNAPLTSSTDVPSRATTPGSSSSTSPTPSESSSTLMAPLVIYGKPVPAEVIDSTAASSEIVDDTEARPTADDDLASTTLPPRDGPGFVEEKGNITQVVNMNNSLPIVDPEDWMKIDTPNFPAELFVPALMGNPIVAGILGELMGQLISSAAANPGLSFAPNPNSCCSGSNSGFKPIVSLPAISSGEGSTNDIEGGLTGSEPWVPENSDDQRSMLLPPPMVMNNPYPNQRWYPSVFPRFSHQGYVPDEKRTATAASSHLDRSPGPRANGTTGVEASNRAIPHP